VSALREELADRHVLFHVLLHDLWRQGCAGGGDEGLGRGKGSRGVSWQCGVARDSSRTGPTGNGCGVWAKAAGVRRGWCADGAWFGEQRCTRPLFTLAWASSKSSCVTWTRRSRSAYMPASVQTPAIVCNPQSRAREGQSVRVLRTPLVIFSHAGQASPPCSLFISPLARFRFRSLAV